MADSLKKMAALIKRWQTKVAPCDFEEEAGRLSMDERKGLMDNMERIAIVAAIQAGYLSNRYGYGCGDQGHRNGMRQAESNRKRIRRVFGYNG